jgi:hypothetical protein
MAIAATVLLTLGILIMGFGLMSLGNVLNLPLTRTQAEHADITDPRHRMMMVRIIMTGLALMAIGLVCGLIASA